MLGVTGEARNLPDGSVEVLACGPETAVQALVEWLWTGPPLAHVTAVDVSPLEDADAESLAAATGFARR